jgi:hypothetical protein
VKVFEVLDVLGDFRTWTPCQGPLGPAVGGIRQFRDQLGTQTRRLLPGKSEEPLNLVDGIERALGHQAFLGRVVGLNIYLQNFFDVTSPAAQIFAEYDQVFHRNGRTGNRLRHDHLSTLNSLGKSNLALSGQEVNSADLAEIRPDRIMRVLNSRRQFKVRFFENVVFAISRVISTGAGHESAFVTFVAVSSSRVWFFDGTDRLCRPHSLDKRFFARRKLGVLVSAFDAVLKGIARYYKPVGFMDRLLVEKLTTETIRFSRLLAHQQRKLNRINAFWGHSVDWTLRYQANHKPPVGSSDRRN